jgi:hypothetical protein
MGRRLSTSVIRRRVLDLQPLVSSAWSRSSVSSDGQAARPDFGGPRRFGGFSPRRRNSFKTVGGIARHPQALACATCHWTRWLSVEPIGMGCCLCHLAFINNSSRSEKSYGSADSTPTSISRPTLRRLERDIDSERSRRIARLTGGPCSAYQATEPDWVLRGISGHQVRRLCGVERTVCKLVLEALVDARFLCVRDDGAYARLTDGERARPRTAKADLRASGRVAQAS